MPPFGAQRFEHRVDAGDVLDVAGQNQGYPKLLGQRLDAFAQRLALIGEGKLGALRSERFGNAPGNRMIIGDAHDQAALAFHQILHARRAFSCVMSGLVPAIHVFLTSRGSRRGWPGAQTSIRSLRQADYYARP